MLVHDFDQFVWPVSVADGVNKFKEGKHTEAMQLLNKALQIDEDNVEALVARGAVWVPLHVATDIYSKHLQYVLQCW